MKNLEKEKFPKIDVPIWGNLIECKNYLEHSITEGNQVIEAKFIYGDETIDYKLSQMRGSVDRKVTIVLNINNRIYLV